MDPTNEVLLLGAVIGLVIAFLLWPLWVAAIALRLLALALFILKWLIVVGLVVSFSCCPQIYCVVGWTPASVLFGDDIYAPAIRELGLKPPQRAKAHRISTSQTHDRSVRVRSRP